MLFRIVVICMMKNLRNTFRRYEKVFLAIGYSIMVMPVRSATL